jgi:hypothetical protein
VQTGPHSSSAGRGAIILAWGRKRKAPSTKRTSGRFAGDTLRRRAGMFELWTGQPQRPDSQWHPQTRYLEKARKTQMPKTL